jgi:UDP-hydrolysing UDP-N-acetyl-D-glucosamine 2-epimerase
MSEASGPPGDGSCRAIAVLTTGRQDWGVLHSTVRALRQNPELELRLIAGGMHLSSRYGRTIDMIREDGFEPAAELDWLGDGDPPAETQAGVAISLIGDWLRQQRPGALLIVGDRFETAAAALAATLSGTPIAHLHGGEQTLGAFDDQLRHAITKLSHLHLVSHEEHARRVVALGEDPATVHVVGAPGLDAADRDDLPDRKTLEREIGIELRPPVVIVTVHPATLDADPGAVAVAVATAMDAVPATYVVTLPNADPGGEQVRRILTQAAGSDRRSAVDALGERRYWGLMRVADAMLGNSSSGIVEAPAVDLPAVNVGDRQLGRRREANVIDTPVDADRIAGALRAALLPETRNNIAAHHPALADGQAGQRVADIIARWRPSIPPRKAPIDVTR